MTSVRNYLNRSTYNDSIDRSCYRLPCFCACRTFGLHVLQAHQLVRSSLVSLVNTFLRGSTDGATCYSYQNHRRYVRSVETDQLHGKYISAYASSFSFRYFSSPRSALSADLSRPHLISSDLDSGDCKPITSVDGRPYYPCGLIANSVFNGPLDYKSRPEPSHMLFSKRSA